MENELKPCPFCGESGDSTDLQRGTPDREGTPTNVTCGKCGACGPWEYEVGGSDYFAIAAWNARAGNAVNAGEVERLVDAYGDACTRFGARSVERTAARAALLAAVKGGK